MFHYTPRSVNSREKYLAALADAKAAEAEYLAAESIHLEEQALRRRLDEIQLQKQRQGHPLRNSTFGTGQGDFIPSLDIYEDRYTHGYDRLASLRLRIELEEEERLRAQNRERERLRRLEEEMRLRDAVARRQAEFEQGALRLRREEKARVIITLDREKRSAQRRAREEPARKDPHCFVLEGHPSREDRYPRQAEEVSLHPHLRAILGDQVRVIPGPPSSKHSHQAPVEAAIPPLLEQLFGRDRSDAAKPKVQAPVTPENIQQGILNLLFGGSEQHASAAPKPSSSQTAPATQHPESLTAQQVMESLLGAAQNKSSGGCGSSHTAQTSCCPSKAQAAQPPSSQAVPQAQFPHPEALQQLLGLFLGGQRQQPAPQASSASSQTQPSAAPLGGFEQIMNTLFGQQEKEQQSQAKPNTSTTPEAWKPSTSSTESSLKADLESRLNNEYATEVRDTIQAILASLADSQAAPASTSASASGPSTPGSSKGKEKASERPVAPATSSENATSKDVIQALNEVHNIEAALSALETEFTFPSQLDFLASHLTSDSHASDSETSATSHLAFTSRNHPVRFYEQALSSLLSQLDSVDSFGNDDLRLKRKQVVDRVEKALEELESEVGGRWRTRVAKEHKSFKVTVVDTETASTPSSDAQAETPCRTEQHMTVSDVPTLDVSSKSEGAVQTFAVSGNDSAVAPPEARESAIDASSQQEEDFVPVDAPLTDITSADEPSLPSSVPEDDGPSEDTTDNFTNDANDTNPTTLTPSLADSVATIRPTDSDASPVDTFLLPAYLPVESTKPKRLPSPERDVDAGSDWSEVEA